MQVATILKNKFTNKQILIGGAVIGGVVLISVIIFGYLFLTGALSSRANDKAPSNVNIETPSNTGAKVSWSTGIETVPVIEYGESPDPGSFKPIPASATPSTSHSVDLSSLEPGKLYYFQIKVGDEVFDNNGLYWTFSTPLTTSEGTEIPEGETPEGTPSASLSPGVNITILPTPSQGATSSASITPVSNPTPTLFNTGSTTPVNPICTSSNCSNIQKNLGTACSTQDYLKCVFNLSASTTPEATTPTTASTSTTGTSSMPSSSLKSLCKPTYFQANSCTNFSWTDMADIDKSCGDTFKKYFIQCKNTSFSSTDTATWYCNETVDTNSTKVPCANAPTPAPGQSIFCRVRAETEAGGGNNATDWVYTSSTCNSYSSSNIEACRIKYLQSNNCRSWIWDLVNAKDPVCKDAFSHYFLQCTSNGNFAHLTTTPTPYYWYCNTTSEDHFFDFPCYNAPTPEDGADITCRVRAEDGYGTDNHATDWITTSATCPTSTPTPSITATPTNTPTPTSTPTPTP